ncbi:MAG: hypothetical protein IKZ28_04460, partial [Clostridia bacterium]|nr:hypothetical protein [Clostridia bacterium]
MSETLTAATCTTKGQKSKVCLDCDYVFPAEELPALGHQFGESEEIAATCLSAKVVVQQCGRCNEIVEETIGEALGHDYKLQGESSATCTEPAMNTYKCDRNGCNATKSEVVNGSTALGHNYVHMTEKDVTATCTQAGEEVWECTNDGCEESYCNIVSPLDHLPENEGTVTAPTCTEKGYTSMHCTRSECGEDYKINLVPELGHSLVDSTSVTASCDTMGYDRKACERDGCTYEVRSNVVANTAHTFDNSGVCSGCGKGAMEVFALTCGDTALYSIEKVGDEYIVYAPSYKLYTYVVMPANVLQALYAQGVYSFNVMLGSRTDNVTKAMAFNIQGGQDINVNVLANEMKEMTSYTFADENGILAKDKDGITFGVYYRVMDELTAAIGETQVSAYAISFQYNIAFSSDNVDSYFKTVLPYTYNQESGAYTFTDVNTSGNNTVTLRQELLQYYYDQGYRTLDITLATAAGQHFAKNLKASATGIETLTTGDTNDMSTTLAGIDLESILSSDLKLDIYCSDHYGTAWNPEEPMDSFLLSFKWIMPDPEFDVEDTTTYFKSDLNYTYDEESGVYIFTDVNTSGYNTVVVRQELLQYYLNNGYKTLTIMVNAKAGQHFSQNLTAKYGDGQTATSGDTNMTAVISELSLEALVSGNVTLDLYASDNYGREGFEAFDIVESMDCFLLTLKFEKEK